MTVAPATGLLTNSILGAALLLHDCCAFTQIPPPPLQHVRTTHRESAAQSASVLQAGLPHDVVPGTQSPLPPLRAPQIQPDPQPT
jgi:hypothetical protein